VSKLSKTQRAALQLLVDGHELYSAIGDSHHWFNDPPRTDIHSHTLYSLDRRGWIEQIVVDGAPYWRRDFAITQAGRDALAEALSQ